MSYDLQKPNAVSAEPLPQEPQAARLKQKLWALEARISRSKEIDLETVEALRELVEALPCTTDEFGQAITRLQNAVRYQVGQERGAARYEMMILLRQLWRLVSAAVYAGRRRRLVRSAGRESS